MGLFSFKSLSDLFTAKAPSASTFFSFEMPSAPKLGAIFGAALTFGVMVPDDAEAQRVRIGPSGINIQIAPFGRGIAPLMRPSRSFGMNCNPTVLRDGRGRRIAVIPAPGCSGGALRSRPSVNSGACGGGLRVRSPNGGYRCIR